MIEHIIKKKLRPSRLHWLSVLTIVKDKIGKITIAEFPDLEEKLLGRESIVEVEKQPILKWVDVEKQPILKWIN